ncbi:MAG: hypothetical protein LAN62_10790 [Acidobacteriia bacterium]|nr:hypothetical protein [Terriglobia bacterium]
MAKVGYGSLYGIFCGIVTVILAVLFAYKSFQPVMHLRPEPPTEFLDMHPGWTTAQRRTEERLARAYWQSAIKLSRGVFTFGDRLPDQPSDVFSIDTNAYPSAVESAAAARLRYWRNLQKVWTNPEVWRKSYEWRIDWLTRGNAY